ncbi:MAG: Wzy polymerase domain-containing protein [Rhodocyclaceae bacterium]
MFKERAAQAALFLRSELGNALQTRLLLVAGLMLCLSWLIPNHYPIWSSFYNEFSAACGLIVLCIATSVRGRIVSPRWYLVFLPLIPLLQWAIGIIDFFGSAFIASLYLAAFVSAISVGFNWSLEGDETLALWLARCLLLGALVSVGIAFLQWSGLYRDIWIADYASRATSGVLYQGRPYGNLAQPNNLSTLCALGLASAIYLFQSGRLARMALILVSLLLLFGWVMTGSKTQFLQVAAFVAVWRMGAKRSLIRLSATGVAVWCTLYVALTVAWPSINRWAGLAVSEFETRQGTVGTRWDLWQQLTQALLSNPLMGWGWNGVARAQYAVALDFSKLEYSQHAHNIVLDLLLWNGIPLGLGLVFSAAIWGYGVWRKCDRRSEWFSILVIVLVGMHALVELPHGYLYFLVPFGLAVGISGSRYGSVPPGSYVIPRPLSAGLVCLAVALSTWVWHDYRSIENDFRIARFNAAGFAPMALEARSKSIIFDQLEAILTVINLPVVPALWADHVGLLGAVTSSSPTSNLLSRHAIALAEAGQEERALEELIRLRAYWGDEAYRATYQSTFELTARYPELTRFARTMPAPQIPRSNSSVLR